LGAVVVAVLWEDSDHVLDIAGKDAVGGEAPGFGAVGFPETKLVEGDGKLDDIPPILDPSGAVPDGVPAGVHALVEADIIPLDTDGISGENEVAPLIVKGVELEEDMVVVEDLVAVGVMGPDQGGLGVPAAEGGQEIILVGGQKTFRLDRRSDVLSGFDFITELEDAGRFPNFIIQDSVDFDREGCLRNGQRNVRRRGGGLYAKIVGLKALEDNEDREAYDIFLHAMRIGRFSLTIKK